MSLLAIKAHLMEVRMASLGSLCHHFRAEPETMRCLLKHWVCKGKVRACKRTPACGSRCAKCPVSDTEMYEWVQ